MSAARRSPAGRAGRLARCYPRAWRDRYGDEFTQLLIDDISERPRSWRRTADVVRGGALTRLTRGGLAGDGLEADAQVRAGLAWLAFAAATFLVLGIAIWSQLTIGWQWSGPTDPSTRAGMVVMSVALVCFVGLAVLAAVPVVWMAAGVVARRDGRPLARPLITAVVGVVVLIVGSRHFAHGWPGTGGRPWSGRGLVPGSVASFAWASTLWVTSYWAHPGALSAFPVGELAWMAACPFAVAAAVLGAWRTLRKIPLTPGVLRYQTRVAAATAVTMAGFLAGAGSWVLAGGPAPRGLFRVGAIDDVGIVLMTAAVVLAWRALQRAQMAAGACRAAR